MPVLRLVFNRIEQLKILYEVVYNSEKRMGEQHIPLAKYVNKLQYAFNLEEPVCYALHYLIKVGNNPENVSSILDRIKSALIMELDDMRRMPDWVKYETSGTDSIVVKILLSDIFS